VNPSLRAVRCHRLRLSLKPLPLAWYDPPVLASLDAFRSLDVPLLIPAQPLPDGARVV
jgi:hypothetical protein